VSVGGLKSWWSNSPAWQKLLGCGALAALVVALVLSRWVLAPSDADLSPLFTDLSPRDASSIVAYLEEEGITYRLDGRGNTILVPTADVYRLRLDLAGQGLPSGDVVGLEIMDSLGMGVTEFERHLAFVRGLQGELSRTIEQLDAVEDARVSLVLPQESVFISQQRPPSAAVLLRFKPGASTTPEDIRGIMHLVAASVEGLVPENVTVLDTRAQLLSAEVAESVRGSGGGYLDVQSDFQHELERRTQSLLEQVLGPGNVVTRVTAEMNFDQKTVETQLFTPAGENEGLTRTVQELREQFEGTGSAAAGLPAGGDANLPAPPGYPAVSGESTTSTYERDESNRTYELNQTHEVMTIAPGTVKRLTVAVVVNRQELTAEEQQGLQSVVAAAIGYDQARNDNITVYALPFDTTLADELAAQWEQEQNQATQPAAEEPAATPFWYLASAGVMGALLLGGLVFILARRRRRPDLEESESADRPQQEPTGPQVPASQQRIRQVLEMTDQRRQLLLDALGPMGGNGQEEPLAAFAREKPERIANMIRNWLAESARS